MMEEMVEFREMLVGRCAFCERELAEGEMRVVLPTYVREHDEAVRSGLVEQRFICAQCAMSLKSKERARARSAAADEMRRIVAFLQMMQ